jgi:hypothetical protein
MGRFFLVPSFSSRPRIWVSGTQPEWPVAPSRRRARAPTATNITSRALTSSAKRQAGGVRRVGRVWLANRLKDRGQGTPRADDDDD